MPPDATPTTTSPSDSAASEPDPASSTNGGAPDAKVDLSSAVAPPPPGLPRVLENLHHGGHAVADKAPSARLSAPAESSALADVVPTAATTRVGQITTPFGYLFPTLQGAYPHKHLPVEPASTMVTALKALGSAMVDAPAPADPVSTIPPVYTYWGQFVDHDITANTDREDVIGISGEPLTPIEPGLVLGLLRNLRHPALNLDSVYGTGPGDPVVAYKDATRLETGPLTELDFTQPFLNGQVPVPGADLPRNAANGQALIGDSRNDENLIVAQLHLAFLEFHNKAVQYVIDHESSVYCDDDARFQRARQLTRWHYQRITVEDFLRRIAMGTVVDEALAAADNPVVRTRDGKPEVFMPLEHSVAAYRFGHSMVRADYDHNENFGRPQGGDGPKRATFKQLFEFTGNNRIQGPDAHLPDNWPIRWERFTDGDETDRRARKIDTHLAPPLKDLTNEGKDKLGNDLPLLPRRILKRLAVRNLLRGYRLAIPTGQAVAEKLGVAPLTEQQLLGTDQGIQDALLDGGFVKATPLWFYILREAEVAPQSGERLGPVGSYIVCTTIIGQIKADPDSYLRKDGGPWTFADGVKLSGNREVATIRDFLEFAGVMNR